MDEVSLEKSESHSFLSETKITPRKSDVISLLHLESSDQSRDIW